MKDKQYFSNVKQRYIDAVMRPRYYADVGKLRKGLTDIEWLRDCLKHEFRHYIVGHFRSLSDKEQIAVLIFSFDFSAIDYDVTEILNENKELAEKVEETSQNLLTELREKPKKQKNN